MATKSAAKKQPTVIPVSEDERAKALEMAKSQLTKKFGDGIIMKLGENTHMNISAVHTGSIALDMALGIGGVRRDESSKSTVPNPRVKPPLPFTSWPRCRRRAARRPSLMPSTRSTRSMPRLSALILITCSSPSPTRARTRWKSARCLFARARFRPSSSTRI